MKMKIKVRMSGADWVAWVPGMKEIGAGYCAADGPTRERAIDRAAARAMRKLAERLDRGTASFVGGTRSIEDWVRELFVVEEDAE